MKELFKYFENDKASVLFHNSTMDYYRIYDEDIKKSLRSYFNKGESNEEAINILKDINSDVDVQKNNDYHTTLNIKEQNNKIPLEKLVILVTNNCNLRCKYCYAQGGNYGLEIENMNNIDAKKIIDSFVEKFGRINFIQIFGGEPLLNPDVIRFICGYFSFLEKNGIINYMPKFGLVTNGTRFPQQIINIMKEYKFNITISIDGDKIIHDNLRIDCSDRCTFDIVKKNYNNLINSGINKNNVGFECTYTNWHIENNISIVNLLKFFRQEFGRCIIHITPVCIDGASSLSLNRSEKKLIEYLEEAVDYTFDTIINEKLINSSVTITGIIDRLISKKRIEYICPAGLSNLSVTRDGKITPCFTFTGTDVVVGNLDTPIDMLMDNIENFQIKYNQKKLDNSCKDCWAKYVCSLCFTAFGPDVENKDKTYGAQIMCITTQLIIKTVLLKLAEIKSSDKNWSLLQEVIFNQSKFLHDIENESY